VANPDRPSVDAVGSLQVMPGSRLLIVAVCGLLTLALAACGSDAGQSDPSTDRLVPALQPDVAAPDSEREQAGSSAQDEVRAEAMASSGVPAAPAPVTSGAQAQPSRGECPASGPGFFVHAESSFCLRVPDGFLVQTPMPGRTLIVTAAPPEDGGPAPQLLITEEGSAGGRSTAEFAQERTGQILSAGIELQLGSILLGGEQAVSAEVVPGVAPARQAYVIHQDRVYVLTLLPLDPDRPEPSAAAQRLWLSAVESFVFR